MYTRYAVYYTPEAGTPLADFGASWLGWDSASGQTQAHPRTSLPSVAEMTATPRKYGFHGTIKPPFRLADGTKADDLHAALSALCATASPVELDALRLARLGRFLALVPEGATSKLERLAARVVTELDHFRAPATAQELSKRRAAQLTPAQDANLERWGYPYVLDAFRFHMTLTGKLDKPTLKQAEMVLEGLLDPLKLTAHRITGLTLLGEDETGLFHQIDRIDLKG